MYFGGILELWTLDVVLKGWLVFSGINAEIAMWSCLLSAWEVEQSTKTMYYKHLKCKRFVLSPRVKLGSCWSCGPAAGTFLVQPGISPCPWAWSSSGWSRALAAHFMQCHRSPVFWSSSAISVNKYHSASWMTQEVQTLRCSSPVPLQGVAGGEPVPEPVGLQGGDSQVVADGGNLLCYRGPRTQWYCCHWW